MKVLIIGSGGREHALAWKIEKSPLVTKIYCAPGNGGIAQIAECVDIQPEDLEGLLKFAKDKKIDLTVVGPETPLAAGIVDLFEEKRLKIFGPRKLGARLEGSKIFAKEFMYKYGIPTSPFKTFDNFERAQDFVTKARYPLVVKADGLAAGKGVSICQNLKEAKEALQQMMSEKIFNEAGERVVIEECLLGEEVSILAICDGEYYVILDSAQDHKKIFDDDLGPNTGGMGAYSPAPIVTDELLMKIVSQIIDPTLRGMKKEGNPFKGVLYVGLMLTASGPLALEYNVRFGDPEAQVLLPRMKNDLAEVMLAACEGRLREIQLEWDERSCICVVMSSGGYPGKYEVGKEITGLDKIKENVDTIIFHAGTKKEQEKFLTHGGRVLGVTSLGRGIEKTLEKVYKSVEKIKFDKCFFRRDIAAKALQQESRKERRTTSYR